jgi:hypothetical protein
MLNQMLPFDFPLAGNASVIVSALIWNLPLVLSAACAASAVASLLA